jgi:subtilisin family serine protease
MDNKLTRFTLVMVFVMINMIISLCSPSMINTDNENGYIAGNITNNDSEETGTGAQFQRWELLKIEAPTAWLTIQGAKNIVVAILDTGIDDSHSDLTGTVIDRINFSNDSTKENINAHGTQIAGIIAGLANDYGVTGIAYNCSLLDVKVANNNGSTDAQKVAQGIIWAADKGANVISISIVFNKEYALLEYAVDYAWNKGCVIIAAAGNSSSTNPSYPAAYDHVIGVAASNSDDLLAKWANHGNWVKVAAPGVDIYSTVPGNGYANVSGSSFSTALVAGEAALMFAQAKENNGTTDNNEIYNSIINNGDSIITAEGTAKRINVNQAVLSEVTGSANQPSN